MAQSWQSPGNWRGRQQCRTRTWASWTDGAAKAPSLDGTRKCKHRDLLTDLFHYERKIGDSSSLITALTSDNFTPLLFNGNITHAILKMEKHFRVLFKSEMMYEMSRLGGVQRRSDRQMTPRFPGCETGI